MNEMNEDSRLSVLLWLRALKLAGLGRFLKCGTVCFGVCISSTPSSPSSILLNPLDLFDLDVCATS